MTPPIADVSLNPEPLDRGEFDAATLMRIEALGLEWGHSDGN